MAGPVWVRDVGVQRGQVRAETAVIVGGLGVVGLVEPHELVVPFGAQADRLLDAPGEPQREHS